MNANNVIQKKTTNWDDYYSHPFPTSHLTRYFTVCKVLSLLKKYNIKQNPTIVELGGGNSFFFPHCNRLYKPRTYTIIEKNQTGIQKFKKRYANFKNTSAICTDLLDIEFNDIYADIVMSFGLIEHFSKEQMDIILKKHFAIARKGAIVVITFPTPIAPYGLIRSCAEHLGIWKFPDEHPLRVSEVQNICKNYGQLIKVHINHIAMLTQAITLWQAN